MRNQQPAEKVVREITNNYQVHSIFHTLQGEGPFAGMPAVFVRLAGCNIQCPGCDTDYTSSRESMEVGEILVAISEAREGCPTRLVVITGGEPFRQPLLLLVNSLLEEGYLVQIETNGTLYQELPYPEITVVCSPKTGSINKELVPHLAALKYVVDEAAVGADGYPERALAHGTSRLARPPRNFYGRIYLQPYDSGNEENNHFHQVATIDSCFKTGAIYCHQLHKLIGLE
jgi:organic radical activating enzyme